MKQHEPSRARAPLALVILTFVAFVSLGMPDGLLGVAWPRMRLAFGQQLDALGLLLGSMTAGYLVSSFAVGWIMRRLGVGRLLGFSSLATAAALLAYTLVPWWFLVLPFGALAGLGAGAIDAGLNSYVEANFGEGLMQWLHASFGIGITMGPAIMTAGIALFDAWRPGYWIVAALQLILAGIFLVRHKQWDAPAAPEASEKPAPAATPASQPAAQGRVDHSFGHTLRWWRSWVSALVFFLYCGVELGIGHWAYTILTEARQVEPGLAGLLVTLYWGMFTVGRILAGFAARRLGAMQLVWGGMALALAGLGLFAWNPVPLVGFAGLALIGLAIAPIFPGLVSSTAQRVGDGHTASTIGMQMSFASLGVGILPGLYGSLAKIMELDIIPVCAVFCLVAMAVVLIILQKKSAESIKQEMDH